MGLFRSRDKVAIGFGARRVRLLVGRGNGNVRQLYAGSRALPDGAVRVGLRAPALLDRDAVLTALSELVSEARADGLLGATPEMVAVLVADGAFKMSVVPLEGPSPDRADGDRMARWLLRDLVPADESEIRADWSVLQGAGEAGSGEALLSLGGAEAVMSEYEELVADLGWTVGRLVPWCFAAAAARLSDAGDESDAGGAPARDLVLCDADGSLGALFQSDGIPRLHRSWRSQVSGARLADELPALSRYVNDHLETTIAGIRLCGEDAWTAAAAEACRDFVATARTLTPEAALTAAIED